MQININVNSETPFGMFNITEQRSDVILDHIASICETAGMTFPKDYSVLGVVQEEGEHKGELMYRLDNGRMVNEMIEIAQNEDEKNYVLYIAYTGINRVHFLLFEEHG